MQEHLGELNDLATMPAMLDALDIAENPPRPEKGSGPGRAKSLRRAEVAYDALVAAKRFW